MLQINSFIFKFCFLFKFVEAVFEYLDIVIKKFIRHVCTEINMGNTCDFMKIDALILYTIYIFLQYFKRHYII